MKTFGKNSNLGNLRGKSGTISAMNIQTVGVWVDLSTRSEQQKHQKASNISYDHHTMLPPYHVTFVRYFVFAKWFNPVRPYTNSPEFKKKNSENLEKDVKICIQG